MKLYLILHATSKWTKEWSSQFWTQLTFFAFLLGIPNTDHVTIPSRVFSLKVWHFHAHAQSFWWTRQKFKPPRYRHLICIGKTKLTSEEKIYSFVRLQKVRIFLFLSLCSNTQKRIRPLGFCCSFPSISVLVYKKKPPLTLSGRTATKYRHLLWFLPVILNQILFNHTSPVPCIEICFLLSGNPSVGAYVWCTGVQHPRSICWWTRGTRGQKSWICCRTGRGDRCGRKRDL